MFLHAAQPHANVYRDKPEFVKFFVFAVLFSHFDSVVRRKQSFSWISPFILPRSPMEATISRFSAYFVAFHLIKKNGRL
jgi:hypothetical protein